MVIYLSKIEVRGKTDACDFAGSISLGPGLQVISAPNAYGKSLAAKAVIWCLGLEPIFGSPDNDATRLPEAVREELDLAGHPQSKVINSQCTVSIKDNSGRMLEITRPIKGGDVSIATIREMEKDGKVRESKLLARKLTMSDEHGGFQRFLFGWLKWPRVEVPTFRAGGSEVYLENLAPLFYIDQNEGWSDLQALQISRYGQQEIREIAVEYLLGSSAALQARVDRVKASQRAIELKESSRLIADQINEEMLRRGWRVDWSSHGSLSEVVARWSKQSLAATLKKESSVDIAARQKDVDERIKKLTKALTAEPIDLSMKAAPIAASQKSIDLKTQRHALNQDLSTLNTQLRETTGLIDSLEHRIHAASDLLRLKKTGVGRLDHLECPTCHRDFDLGLFGLTSQSEESVAAHIEALRSDRELMLKNRESLSANMKTTFARMAQIDSELRDAEKALATITSAVGPMREQLAATASELAAAERESDRLSDTASEIEALQQSIDRWVADAKGFVAASVVTGVVDKRKNAFIEAFRKYLVTLGHSEVNQQNAQLVTLDEQYIPFMNNKRLRALGSASDQSRLVAAYSLALAAASEQMGGQHPGFVILDEPLQQNPDEKHRELFLNFLTKELPQKSTFQTLIFTWLSGPEIDKLRKQGTNVLTPPGAHFLQLQKPASATPATPIATAPKAVAPNAGTKA
jgi:DNA repair exonuclease SbcCD ATPase subunit